ncbi:ATP-binding protein [Collimonas humicola]|uniref:ATP-binding protein n=1 Tax=Collimonas humicola TaxID=2825886 RepID=UPI002E783D52|nr:ATP-binding protein [Collimonas humicola]
MRLILPGTSIRLKLFYAMLAMAVAVIVAMSVVARLSFTHDFLGYLNEQAQERMEELTPHLEQSYREHGSWQFMRDNPGAWHYLLRTTRPELDSDTPSSRFAPSGSDLTGAHLRFTLLDADRKFVAGFRDMQADALPRPLMRDGAIIGWVALTPFESVITAIDQRFQHKQLLAHLLIGLVSILFTGFIAIKIASVLLSPLTRLAKATHRLAGGDYSTRVEVATQDEIGRLSADFNQLALTLERNEKMRRDFMADVSHELRTPLGILNGQLEAMEDGLLDTSMETVKSLQSEVAALNKLVNDLYELSLADAGALTYRKADIDIGALLRASLQSYEDIYREHRLAVAIDLPEQPMLVHADAGRLQQLFKNILENTLRYTDGGGRLNITGKREQQRWLLQFDDSAPGTTAATLPRLFERFFRADASRNRAHGGAGLGLAICQHIVEAHEGSINADASALGGLHLSIRLPASLA